MKIFKIITISFCIMIVLIQNVYSTSLTDIKSTADSWISTGDEHAGIGLDTTRLEEGSGNLYNVLITIASIVAVIVGALLGLKYMTAGIEEKVEVKKSLIPYLISCIVVFGSIGIWKLVVTILKSF